MSTAVLLYSLVEFYRRVFRSYSLVGAALESGGIRAAIDRLALYGLLQYKVLKYRFPGVMHALIFYGIIILFIATVIRALDYYIGGWLLQPPFFYIYKLANNIAGVIVIVGVAWQPTGGGEGLHQGCRETRATTLSSRF